MSFGPWASLDEIVDWRSRDGWKDRVAGLRDLLDGFEPSTLELVTFRGSGS